MNIQCNICMWISGCYVDLLTQRCSASHENPTSLKYKYQGTFAGWNGKCYPHKCMYSSGCTTFFSQTLIDFFVPKTILLVTVWIYEMTQCSFCHAHMVTNSDWGCKGSILCSLCLYHCHNPPHRTRRSEKSSKMSARRLRLQWCQILFTITWWKSKFILYISLKMIYVCCLFYWINHLNCRICVEWCSWSEQHLPWWILYLCPGLYLCMVIESSQCLLQLTNSKIVLTMIKMLWWSLMLFQKKRGSNLSQGQLLLFSKTTLTLSSYSFY